MFNKNIYKMIDSFLTELLRCENNNMYALNLKVQNEDKMREAARSENREGAGEGSGGSVNGGSEGVEVDRIYTILRLSTLKRHFMKLDRTMQIPLETSIQLKMNIIRLYNCISEFMSDCRVDFDQQPDLKVGHYTRLSALAKLVNQSEETRQRLYNAQHLNDPREGKIFLDLLEQRGQGNELENAFTRRVLESYSGDNIMRSRVYIGSFTASLDKLAMWTRYGDNGNGCCLTVDSKKTFSQNDYIGFDRISLSDKEDSRQFQDSRYALYKVIYYPDICNGGRDLYKDVKMLEADLEDLDRNDADGGNRQNEFTRKFREDLKKLTDDIREEIVQLSSEDIEGTEKEGGNDREIQRDEAVRQLRKWSRELTRVGGGDLGAEQKKQLGATLMKLRQYVGEMGVCGRVTQVIDKILDCFGEISRTVQGLDLEAEGGGRFQEELVNITMVILDQIRYLFKSEYYQDEDEYRLIKHSRSAELDDRDPANPKLYINMKEAPYYTEVCLGPQVRNPQSLAAYLTNNYRGDEERGEKLIVRKSSVQYQTDVEQKA